MEIEATGDRVVAIAGDEAETDALGAALADLLGPGDVVGMVGPLGAGKTRLTRSIATSLGAPADAIASPTFVLIHEYEGRIPIYHFDTYRLNDPEEFESLGIVEYLEGEGVCLVEWADRVAELLPSHTTWVRIEATGPSERRFEISGPRMGPWIADRWKGLGPAS